MEEGVIERVLLSWIGWFAASYFEGGHDWHLHSKCYKIGLPGELKEITKRWDDGEKTFLILFLVGGFELTRTGDPLYVSLMVLLQVALRWLTHEVWYSHHGRLPFGQLGKSCWQDRLMNRLRLGNAGNATIITLPAVILSVAICLIW
jgi:hypothetical protein